MNLDMTSVTLICIALVIFLYLVFGNGNNKSAIKNAGNLNSDVDDDVYESDGSMSASASSAFDESTLYSKNSAVMNGSSYQSSAFNKPGAIRSSSDSIDIYFDTSLQDSGDFSPMSSDSNPPGLSALNGDFEGLNGSGDSAAPYTAYGSSSEDGMFNSAELMPQESNSEWFDIYNSVNINNTNLVSVYRPVGTDTVGTSHKNASHDIRGDVPNPKNPVGPFNNSSIMPDVYHVGLCGNRSKVMDKFFQFNQTGADMP